MLGRVCRLLFFVFFLFSLSAGSFFVVNGESRSVASVESVYENDRSRIAPGEFLPVSVKLVNFGSEKRVDVLVDYKILDSGGREIYSESETVAVETTASFVKRIQLPYNLKTGSYTMITELNYSSQEQPAVSKFPFQVENKIGGFFKSDLIIYSSFVLLLVMGTILITYFLTHHKGIYKVVRNDYSHKSKEEVIYYEILNDVISQMRLRIGDTAIKIAQGIPNLEINSKTGAIINIKKDPAKIVALLIARYEALLGRPISFSIGK